MVAVGTVAAFVGVTVPDGWLLCDASPTDGYPELAALIGAFTPDLTSGTLREGVFVKGAGGRSAVGQPGGDFRIAVRNMPPHTHAIGSALGDHTHGPMSYSGDHDHAAGTSPYTTNAYRSGVPDYGGAFSTFDGGSAKVTQNAIAHAHGISTVSVEHEHGIADEGGGAEWWPLYADVRYIVYAGRPG